MSFDMKREIARLKVWMLTTSDNPSITYFASVGFQIDTFEDNSEPTAYTDGERIGFNSDFMEALSPKERRGLLIHEIAHVALGHVWRRPIGADAILWNIAADIVVNGMIAPMKNCALPKGGVRDKSLEKLSVENVYHELLKQSDEMKQKYGGVPMDLKAVGKKARETAQKKTVQVNAEAAAKGHGHESGHPDMLATRSKEPTPKIEWTQHIRSFVEKCAEGADNYDWTLPSENYSPYGIYLPRTCGLQCGPIVAAVDTSGSIQGDMLRKFLGQLQDLHADLCPRHTTVFDCDNKLHNTWRYESDDVVPDDMKFSGGWGTDFRPVFEAIEDLDEPPVALVYLTDLYGDFPAKEPSYPVLWAVYGGATHNPWGDLVEVK